MPPYKMNFILSVLLLVGIVSCNNYHDKFTKYNSNFIDTTYQTTTKLLKTDKIPDSVFNMQNLKEL